MSGAAEAGETEEFATLLRGLKERSGLSYGALAKRLHMSTSTLHRYCNGTAVPNEYAPVERLARVCRATPRELVELHRHWILADAARRRRAEQAGAARAGSGGATGAAPAKSSPQEAGSPQDAGSAEPAAAAGVPGVPGTGDTGSAADPAARAGAALPAQPGSPPPGPAAPPSSGTAPASGAALAPGEAPASGAVPGPGSGSAPGTALAPGAVAASGAAAASGAGPASRTNSAPGAGSGRAAVPQGGDQDAGPGEPGEPVVVGVAGEPARPRRRRTALIACAAVAAVLGAVAIVVQPLSGKDGDDPRDEHVAGATAVSGTADAESPTPAPSPSGRSRTPSASASATATGSGAPSVGGKQGAAAGPSGGTGTGAVPLTVGTRPYVYEDPCSQHFLVDSEPEQVGPPANEQNAPRWAAAYGAVSSGEQRVALTVQGTGADTVVLEALHVRVIAKGAPLAWNDYSMGVGCGGGVGTKSFDIDLDNGSPTVTVKNGQRDFPYKVSESDPEVFYVTARTEAHDVRWDLTLDWSSGSRRGTLHIDNAGIPFRTSADVGRPGYDYPLGSNDWIERVG
ncbi:helix-turn-helix domain-containing protein [Streptomyces sp. NPDC102462]|uniref:transcriptional regulator n=1 Tax=Streptomyces sp. NPDC102462 TaxID=3366178 RepID=UPI00380F887C